MIITTGNNVSLTTAEHRNQTAALLPPAKVALEVRGGVHSGLALSKTTGMTFRIAPGRAIVPPATPSAGPYVVTVLDPETLTFDAGDTSRNRIDVVAIKVNEADTTDNPASVVILKGSYPSSGNPVQPNVPDAHVPLYAVPINAGMTAGSGGFNASALIDLRRQVAAMGASIPVHSQAERDELQTYNGLTVMRLDLGGSIDRYVGGRWRGNTGWIYPTVSSTWAPVIPAGQPKHELTRLRCKVVGDGTQLAIWGEMKYTGSGNVAEGMVIGQIPANQKITPEDGSWILGTDENYAGFCFVTVSKSGQIKVGPRPGGKVFMFQGTVPLDFD